MNETLKITEIKYLGKINCAKCGKEFDFEAINPDESVDCNYCNEYQTFKRENIEKIDFNLKSETPEYSTSGTFCVSHVKKELILHPPVFPSYMGPENTKKMEKDIKELLKEKGKKLTEENFWKGYTFIEDINGIT